MDANILINYLPAYGGRNPDLTLFFMASCKCMWKAVMKWDLALNLVF